MAERNSRREFLRGTGGGLLLVPPGTAFGTAANSAVELGLLGCGGRGTWIAQLFTQYSGARIVALADAFRDRLEPLAKRYAVPPSRQHAGLDGYKDLSASHLDAVVVETPPYYHPDHAAAAVAAGKHVFLAKPVAVDVPGCRSIMASGEKARQRLSFLVDFQTRAQAPFRECADRVHRGDIGRPVLGHAFYHTNRLRPQNRPGDTPAQARLRNWVFDKVLSGDILVEQHVHVLDVADWFLDSHPLKAYGTGGRKARTDVGDCWDHFLATYWYPNEVKLDFSSAQFLKGFHDACLRLYGTAGTAEAHYGGAVRVSGDKPWPGVDRDDTFTQGAVANIKSFVESIRSGKYLNNASRGAESTLTAILGRTAAYQERVVTWEEMLHTATRYDARLAL